MSVRDRIQSFESINKESGQKEQGINSLRKCSHWHRCYGDRNLRNKVLCTDRCFSLSLVRQENDFFAQESRTGVSLRIRPALCYLRRVRNRPWYQVRVETLLTRYVTEGKQRAKMRAWCTYTYSSLSPLCNLRASPTWRLCSEPPSI